MGWLPRNAPWHQHCSSVAPGLGRMCQLINAVRIGRQIAGITGSRRDMSSGPCAVVRRYCPHLAPKPSLAQNKRLEIEFNFGTSVFKGVEGYAEGGDSNLGVACCCQASLLRSNAARLFAGCRMLSRPALPQKFADRNEVFASAKNPTEGEVGEVPTCLGAELTLVGAVASDLI